MFPLTLVVPKYKESLLVGFADKVCTVKEMVKWKSRKTKKNRSRLDKNR